MLRTLAVEGYRSLRSLAVEVRPLTVVVGANGVGKSNLYRALRLLAEAADGRIASSIAREGGLDSVFWAGPEVFSRAMKAGEQPVEGTRRNQPYHLRLGFESELGSYAIDLGNPPPSKEPIYFPRDPQIKRECIWHGPAYRPASCVVNRTRDYVEVRDDDGEWQPRSVTLPPHLSLLSEVADAENAPEAQILRNYVRSWRFYDHFRCDPEAPSRTEQVATHTDVLSSDGSDFASALQTIRAVGDRANLERLVEAAFPGAKLELELTEEARISLKIRQHGMLRALRQSELSDGTMRFLIWLAALLTPRPPGLMVLNEPETSLHPQLIPVLADLIITASRNGQVWVVTHSDQLLTALQEAEDSCTIALTKELGETLVSGQTTLTRPIWKWPSR